MERRNVLATGVNPWDLENAGDLESRRAATRVCEPEPLRLSVTCLRYLKISESRAVWSRPTLQSVFVTGAVCIGGRVWMKVEPVL